MKLIAKRDFRNPQRKLEIKDAIHPDHVHMGARFTIGPKPESTFKELRAEDQLLVSQLSAADCISDATDEKIVASIDAATDEREKAEANQAKQSSAGAGKK